jgi:hypothetical protein
MVRETPPVTDDPSITTTPRELDSRASDGIRVQLLWHPIDDHVSIAVNDTKNGDAFELAVRNGQRALDVFYHPFAYAAGNRGMDKDKTPTATSRVSAVTWPS